jgi:SAM-dependent methyltransferase
MKKWVLKAVVQKIISWLPASHKVNYWFQKNITKGVRLSEQYLHDKLRHAHDHLRLAHKAGLKRDFVSLELGTGWYPIVPILMFLAGAKKSVTVDLNPLMTYQNLSDTVLKLQAWLQQGKLRNFDQFMDEARKKQFLKITPGELDFEALKEALNLDYRVGDARALPYSEDFFDLIHSNNVFEHIYPDVLEAILWEFGRILKPKGISSHFIDMSDHFAHLDSSIGPYNFLRFSQKQWSWIDNSVQPQNRWRLSDYEQLYAKLGLVIKELELRKGEPQVLSHIKLNREFLGYKKSDLAITHAHLLNLN